MLHRLERRRADSLQVELGVFLLVDLTHDGDGVAAHQVHAKHVLHDALRLGEDSLVRLEARRGEGRPSEGGEMRRQLRQEERRVAAAAARGHELERVRRAFSSLPAEKAQTGQLGEQLGVATLPMA